MNLVEIVFSYDRPLQLWGLVKSILDNCDMEPSQITCICKSTTDDCRRAYNVVASELGCRVLHEPPASKGFLRRFSRSSLYGLMLRLTRSADFVSLAVDDMMFFRKTSFEFATRLLAEESDICLWTWRIGADTQPHELLQVNASNWQTYRAIDVMPYRYIFHTDGSVYRRKDLEYWLHLLPRRTRKTMDLNQIESCLAMFTLPGKAETLRIGAMLAGPLRQTCALWQVNKTSPLGGAKFCETEHSRPERLLRLFNEGWRLDYTPLYGRTDWLLDLNRGYTGCHLTHVAPTEEAVQLWAQCIVRPSG